MAAATNDELIETVARPLHALLPLSVRIALIGFGDDVDFSADRGNFRDSPARNSIALRRTLFGDGRRVSKTAARFDRAPAQSL